MLSPDFLFPRFLVFPPANPSTLQMFFYPDSLSFSVHIEVFKLKLWNAQVEHQEADEKTVYIRTGIIILFKNIYAVVLNSWVKCLLLHVDLLWSAVQEQEA